MSKASLLSRSRGDRAMRMKSLTLLLVLMTASVAFAAGAEIEGKASVPENTIRINSDKSKFIWRLVMRNPDRILTVLLNDYFTVRNVFLADLNRARFNFFDPQTVIPFGMASQI